jgi:hypothetical protein
MTKYRCEHEGCGINRACCVPECPIKMCEGESHSGFWRWELPAQDATVANAIAELATLRTQVAQLNLELECRKIILQPSDGWMFYHDGVYGPATEKELRDFSCRLGLFSDQKGIASVVMQQMWAEIDKLRAASAAILPTIVAQERERCAKVCEARSKRLIKARNTKHESQLRGELERGAAEARVCAAAIRAGTPNAG